MFGARSKYQNILGTVNKKENHRFGFDPIISIVDSSNGIGVNGSYTILPWKPPAGRVILIGHNHYGRVGVENPILDIHSSTITDISANPHNDNIFATGAEDGDIKVFKIDAQDNFGVLNKEEGSMITLTGHSRRVTPLFWHNSAANTLFSSSTDLTIRGWDVEKGKESILLKDAEKISDIVTSFGINPNGSLLTIASKNKTISVADIRSNQISANTLAHEGAKAMNVFWVGDNFFSSTGYNATMTREIKLWDARNLTQSVTTFGLGTGAGTLMPIYDEDTGIVLLPARGDGNIKICDISTSKGSIIECAAFQSAIPTVGVGALPKRSCDVMSNEIMRIVKLTPDNVLCNISFTIPRKSTNFQDDIFVPTWDGKASMSHEQWMKGENVQINKISLQPEGVIAESSVEKPKVEVKQQAAAASKAPQRTEKEALAHFQNMISKFNVPEPTAQVTTQSDTKDDEWDD